MVVGRNTSFLLLGDALKFCVERIAMFCVQDPTVGAWFVNLTGQLIKVKLVMFDEDKLQRVLIQYLDGTTKLINRDDWFCLKLNKHIHEAGMTMQLH